MPSGRSRNGWDSTANTFEITVDFLTGSISQELENESNLISATQDILRSTKVRNLDTGEEMNIDEAEDQLPATINPLSLHIMRMTSEYVRSVAREGRG